MQLSDARRSEPTDEALGQLTAAAWVFNVMLGTPASAYGLSYAAGT